MEVVRIAGDGSEPLAAHSTDRPVDERHPLVLVTWRDAWFDFEQPDGAEPRSDYLVQTVGFVVGEGPRFLSVAQELLPDGEGCRAVTHIPISVVASVVRLDTRPDGPTAADAMDLYSADADATSASDLGRRDA